MNASDARTHELIQAMKGVDSVELKLTVPESAHRSTVSSLGLDPLESQIRQVFFFDTPDLALDAHGLVVRARRSQKKGDDSVVKLRPVVASELPAGIRTSASFGVELDVSPESFVVSGSMKGVPATGSTRAVAQGSQKIRKLFSKEQQALFKAHAPKDVALDDLLLLGPLFVLKLKSSPPGFGRKLVAEMWLYPDGSRILELSTKCLPSDAFQAAAESRAYLSSQGVDLSGEQQTKTRTALEFFAKELRSEASQ
jgi:hypothetical protein